MFVMRSAMIALIIPMKLFVLPMFVKAVPEEIKDKSERSDFEYEQKFATAHYWSSIFCHTTMRPTTVFLEVYQTNDSLETQDFFNIFASDLYNTRLRCINAMFSSSYNIEYWPDENANWPWLREINGSYFAPDLSILTPIPQVESFLFNNPVIARVIIIPLEAVDFLMEYKFEHWDRKQYVMILIISKNDHAITKMCINNMEKVIINITINILKTLWEKRGAYNIFIGFPLLGFHGSRLWLYDPFYRDNINANPGRLVAANPMRPFNFKKLRNLQGYKLDIGLFEGKLTAEIRSGKSQSKNYQPVIEDFHGVDGYIVQTMSKHFNFTVNIVPPSGGVKYGHVRNGTPVGTLGDVAYRRIHASFNSQYVKEYITGNQQLTSLDIEFTIPVDWDRVCIIVPSSAEIPRWLRPFIYMQPAIWACLLVAIILTTIVWHLLRNYHHSASRNYPKCHKNYFAVFIDTFMLLIGAPVRSPNVLGERILVGALAFLGLTVMGAFTGTLYHSFTNEMYYRPIETLEELDTLGLLIATSSPNLENIFGPKNPLDESSILSRLAQKIKSLPDNNVSTIKKTAFERNIAAIYREKVFLIERHQYVDSKGRSLLHLVSDCPQPYYLAYLMPANSIFLEPFNSIITGLNEAGITLFWNDNKIQQSNTGKIKSTVADEVNEILDGPRPFSIQDMEICFLILAFGLVISITVFMIEWMDIKKLKRIIVGELRSE